MTAPMIPAGLDARPVTRYTVHCSECGKPIKGGEFDSVIAWQPEALSDLGAYESLEGWELDVDGRKVVCPACVVGYCEYCINKVYTWQKRQGDPSDDGVWHTECEPAEDGR